MLRYSKSAITSLGISSLSYMPMHDMLNIRKYAKNKSKSKKNQNALYMIASVSSRRCGSHRMYLESDSPYQEVMIVCELKWFSHISNCHNIRHLYNLAMSFTHNMQKPYNMEPKNHTILGATTT